VNQSVELTIFPLSLNAAETFVRRTETARPGPERAGSSRRAHPLCPAIKPFFPALS
jgi:hypothetical protein